jgi:hypothetical protein
MALQSLPLRVGKIAWVIGSHPFSLSHERPFAHLQNTLLGAKIDRTARDNKRLIEELEEQVNITNPHKN